MEWLGELLGFGASVASGGLFGLLGSVVGVGAKYLQEKQRQAWEREKWSHEQALLKLQMDARAVETEHELAILGQQGSWEGLAASHAARIALKDVHTWVNDLRALFRPVLTVGLWVLAGWVFWEVVSGTLTQWMQEADIADVIRYCVHTVFFSASTATVWWFGDRALTPPQGKGR